MGWSPTFSAAGARIRYGEGRVHLRAVQAGERGPYRRRPRDQLESPRSRRRPRAAAQATVHSNSNITVSNGNPTVTGPVSRAAAAAPRATTTSRWVRAPGDQQSIPTIDGAQRVHAQRGELPRLPGSTCAPTARRAPGDAAVLAPARARRLRPQRRPAGGTFRNGWTYNASTSPPTWKVTGDSSTASTTCRRATSASGTGRQPVGQPGDGHRLVRRSTTCAKSAATSTGTASTSRPRT